VECQADAKKLVRIFKEILQGTEAISIIQSTIEELNLPLNKSA
jgi:hypothetical protein